MTTADKINAVMQSGLQFRFYNKPVQDDYLWDIKVFWEHVGVTTEAEPFDDIEECVDDCWDYLQNYKNLESSYGYKN